MAFFTGQEIQERNMREHSLPPAYEHMYDDPELVEESPYLPDLKESVLNGIPRPRVIYYGDTTAAIQDEAYAAIAGEKSPERALTDLQTRLESTTL